MKTETRKELSESGYDITPLNAETIERLAQDLNEEECRDDELNRRLKNLSHCSFLNNEFT